MMMFRVKYDGKCRKATQVPASIEELRKKIAELFGSEASKQEITYKDCDGELVSVVDSEDLKSCVAEAEAYKMTCITLLVKEGAVPSRSVSSKLKSSETSEVTDSNTSDSDDSNGFKVVGDHKAIKAKAEEEAEMLKKKLIEEHQKALAQLELETQSKIDGLEKRKENKLKELSAEKKERKRCNRKCGNELKPRQKSGDDKEKTKEEKHAEKDRRRAEKDAEKESRKLQKNAEKNAEKEARMLQKDAEKAERHAKRLEEKLAKGEIDEKEVQIRAKVQKLMNQFPHAHRPSMRANVIQNPTLTPQELILMIKANRVAKSSSK